MERLLRRRDFLAAARGLSQAAPAVVVQLRPREDAGPPRVGFTVTSKLGHAVRRNRIRRRLKEAVRLAAADCFRAGNDYVIIGRAATIERSFQKLAGDIISAIDQLHRKLEHSNAAAAAGKRQLEQDSL
jgi:ribonuclease P protein component